MSPRRQRMIPIVMGAAPVVAALVAMVASPSMGPRPTLAATTKPRDLPPAPAKVALTSADRAAIDLARSLLEAGSYESPFLHASPPRAATSATTIPGESREPVAPPTLAVTSVMRAPAGVVAIINGKLRRTGDEVAPGWRITTIDPTRGAVTVENGDGETISVSPPRR